MSFRQRLALIIGIATLVVVAMFFFPRIHQPIAYHSFADCRELLGIPFFWDVITNLPFLIIGVLGLWRLSRYHSSHQLFYIVLFSGIFLTGIGSAYYHWQPNNNRLIWDRLPMTIVFMSFFSLLIAIHIQEKMGKRMLFPLLIVGVLSIVWWMYTDRVEHDDDLRPYVLVQFLPMLLLPLLVFLFPTRVYRPKVLLLIGGWYILAKILEANDAVIFDRIAFSGHALKHLAAGVAVWYMLNVSIKEMN
jgi:Ceramidase